MGNDLFVFSYLFCCVMLCDDMQMMMTTIGKVLKWVDEIQCVFLIESVFSVCQLTGEEEFGCSFSSSCSSTGFLTPYTLCS